MKFIKKFEELTLADTPIVGGKNSSLGQMIADLSTQGVRVPTGFAVTAQAYWYFIEQNNLLEKMKQIMSTLTDYTNFEQLNKVGSEIRLLIESGAMPNDLADQIQQAYDQLCELYNQDNCDVAVRSSATAEDLPTASFAGQQETYLNICGHKALIISCKKAMASLFTDRAIAYRIEQGFDHFQVALSVGVQKMIRSDLASAGVAFSLDTESGFKDVVMVDSSYGLGESIVKGEVIPDEFVVHKPTLEQGFESIIKKQLGQKISKIVYAGGDKPTKTVSVSKEEQCSFSLTGDEILELARIVDTIDRHYSKLKGKWSPMDVEWAKDGQDGKLYIIQARPETVHSSARKNGFLTQYKLIKKDPNVLITGQSIGQKIASGKVRVIFSADNIDQVQEGDVLVTDMTDPDWVPAMKKAAGIITNRGGRTCHAAIVSRELNIPAIVGAQGATEIIKPDQSVTIDCSQGETGFVYDGFVEFAIEEIDIKNISTQKVPCEIMVNIADPASAFSVAMLPNDGVGLARLEFIINNAIQVHPLALVYPEKVDDKKTREKIEKITCAYKDKKKFFIDTLACGIGMVSAAFYPKPVIVRFSDFKTNEYRNLIGGQYFEPKEENPMLGFRGASRYYSDEYKDAFALECAAIKKVRENMGLVNVKVMVPFVRTVEEAEKVVEVMSDFGLEKGKNSIEIVMMCELPSNVILMDQFCRLFDGFSIGSNDLTQLTLGVDRDSEKLAYLFDERDSAVKKMFELAVEGAIKSGRYIGICGQAPSDFPEIAQFLIKRGVTSLSFNADALVPFLMRYE